MHIPDGYLSPSTCATLYGGAIAAWYAALQRLKRVLLSRVVPLISVFAAFSFVVMMFNLPLPGGTTGHAVGVTIAAIVLGPSGAMVAISLALALQALFFGDGGITTLGANCFNMAVIGSLIAYGSYSLLAAKASFDSRRRIVAAAIAGYLAINAAALAAAIELGLQPALFHDPSGTPLYAPYPLRIAVPAMMIGHLTFAGLAEAAIAAGLLAYLQVAEPGLLGAAGGRAPGSRPAIGRGPGLQRIWLLIALLMMLTPLGILAAGKAWGEWSPAELAQSSAPNGSAIGVPAGLQRLANVWSAPFPAYAPAFVRSPHFGYLLSAIFGVGLLLALSLLVQHYLQRRRSSGYSS